MLSLLQRRTIMQNKSQTFKNLEAAFAGESMANRKYLYFAKLAREFGNEEIAKLFENTANQETGHAFSHLELLYPKKDMTVAKILEIAMEGEFYETNTMYPEFEQQAVKDGDETAKEVFNEQKQESSEHHEIFLKAAKRFKVLKNVERTHALRYQTALNSLSSK